MHAASCADCSVSKIKNLRRPVKSIDAKRGTETIGAHDYRARGRRKQYRGAVGGDLLGGTESGAGAGLTRGLAGALEGSQLD